VSELTRPPTLPELLARASTDADVTPEPATKRRSWNLELTARKVKPVELMNLSRQMASFLRAGVPVLDALAIISEESTGGRLGDVLDEVSQALRGGSTLSDAVAAHRDFPNYYVAMLRAAELTGRLDLVFDQLAAYIERDLETRRRIRSAMTYPSVVVVLALASVSVLTFFVLPKFEAFFADLDADLPLPTRLLLGGVRLLGELWPVLVGGACVAALSAFLVLRTERGKLGRDRLLLRLPAVGTMVRYAIVERFCRALASMVEAGVALPEAVGVAAAGTGNRVYANALRRSQEGMLQGEGLAKPIAATGVFPNGVNQMLRVGEATGSVDQQLEGAAAYYQRELDYRLKRFTDLFEPAMVLGVGLIVGFVAIALVSAMYGIFNQVQV
jgi:type IV pilus assembly protein PilC